VIVRPEACNYCGICETICPVGAVDLYYLIRIAYPFSGKAPMSVYTYFPDLIESLPEIPPDSIVSRTLYSGEDMKAVLFGFATGQELSEHTASMPATLVFLQGEADLKLGEDRMAAQAGTWAHMPANLPHSIHARTPVVMLLLMLRTKEGS
jgi:quercetin dioxygenase-like cupin family protein